MNAATDLVASPKESMGASEPNRLRMKAWQVLPVLCIVIAALLLRLHDIGFGLPSLYDPDEPIFMILALKLLKQHTLNPGWFGHPGTTTIYLISLIDVAVYLVGSATGQFHGVHDFTAAAYADPALLFVPARVAMALFGTGCVWLTYMIGRRLFGDMVGLIAAAFLAANSLHILWSQVVRTDVMASFFMLASLHFSIKAAQRGMAKDYLFSGALIGVAIATKWPSAVALIGPLGAAAYRIIISRNAWKAEVRVVSAGFLCAILFLFVASPYILLDWHTVLTNVSGEVNHGHLAQNGGSFAYNLRWYVVGQVQPSMGFIGLALLAVGVAASGRSALARWILLPMGAAFVALICSQSMVWSRWLIPAMPILCILAAVGVEALGEWMAARLHCRNAAAVTITITAVALLPSAASARDKIQERAVDTRTVAADWAIKHFPNGSTVVLENLELKLRDQPWRILFPMGRAGCVDALQILKNGVGYTQVEQLRNGSPIVDIGNVDPHKLNTCHADFAILTYYDLYRAESALYPSEFGNYERLLAGGRTVALFRPRAGTIGGPIVRVVVLAPQLERKLS